LQTLLLLLCVGLPLLLVFVPVSVLLLIGGSILFTAYDFSRTRYKASVPADAVTQTWEQFQASGRIIERETTTKDGIKLRYFLVPPDPEQANGKVALICQPLGNTGFMHWYSTISLLGPGWTVVSWDYRGFYSSEDTRRLRNVSVRNHAEDGMEVLKAALRDGDRSGGPLLGLPSDTSDCGADVVFGHSMGVQVALEFCLLYPDLCGALVLVNGTTGQALQTGLQMTVKIPFLGDFIGFGISWVLRDRPLHYVSSCLQGLRSLALKPKSDAMYRLHRATVGSRTLEKMLGPLYLQNYFDTYLGLLCSTPRNLQSFLRGFQELDAHATDHLLWQINCPMLALAGMWDFLTPAHNMVKLAASVRGETRLVIDPFSGHFTLLENPERALGEIEHFMGHVASRYKRVGSTQFARLASAQLPSTEDSKED